MKRKSPLLFALVGILSIATLGSCGANPSSGQQTSDHSQINSEEEYVVKFNNNYDGTVIRVTVKAGGKVTLPENPTREGYTFLGWFLSYRDDTTEKFNPDTPINSDITVFAKWAENDNERTVTFHYQDNITSETKVVVKKGQTLAKPVDPTYPDGTKSFTGWYTDSNCTKLYDFSLPVTESFDLYAGWKISKGVVTFNYNYTGCPDPLVMTVDLDKPMTKPTDPIREHYAFVGWFSNAVGGTQFDFSQNITGDMVLYAHWDVSEFQITFDPNGGTIASGMTTTIWGKKNGSIVADASQIAEKMTYVGHDFKGWFDTKLDANSDEDSTAGKTEADLANITGAKTVYAGWALSTFTVSFDLGYDGATNIPETQSVKYGKTATEPTAPTRDGYVFSGWFVDTSFTSQFTFDMAVTGNLTLHAKWVEDSSVPTTVKVTYYVGTTVYMTKTISFNSTAESDKPADPTKTNAIFAGWYTDSTLSTKFNMKANLTADVSVYARFLDRYTFEAESIDFTGKSGQGTSTNSFEEQMIMDYTFVKNGSMDTVSNGYFVRELYYNGASLDFVINSSAAIDDVTMYLRVSSESYQFFTTKVKDGVTYNYLSDTEFKIVVNGQWDGDTPLTWETYDGLYMPMANLVDSADLDKNKTPFENCFISSTIHLDQGDNNISLFVDNNNNHGGTFHAEAPIIDCMYLYSSTTLTAHDYQFYTRPNVQRG